MGSSGHSLETYALFVWKFTWTLVQTKPALFDSSALHSLDGESKCKLSYVDIYEFLQKVTRGIKTDYGKRLERTAFRLVEWSQQMFYAIF